MSDPLRRSIERVVGNGNCSGCGACVLVSERVTMALDDSGFARPIVDDDANSADSRNESELFRKICPGRVLHTPPPAPRTHPTFGGYFAAWEGVATDEVVRRAGSSGGVLTALSAWLIDRGLVDAIVSAKSDGENPRRTIPVRIVRRDEALAAAGSRYAPVSVLEGWDGAPSTAIVGKPCEVAAAHAFGRLSRSPEPPVLLSFFCAGTPSQLVTNDLVADVLGDDAAPLRRLQYRGAGWPGRFRAEATDGRVGSLSYEESWGAHLGRNLQWRCKFCVDGTGGLADITVGDYWLAGADGYPVFDDGDGNSVIIARTLRGYHLLTRAAAEGIIAMVPVDLDLVAAIQPLQRQRRQAIAGRLLGRLLSGNSVPSYRGWGVLRRALAHPIANARGALGTFTRSVRDR